MAGHSKRTRIRLMERKIIELLLQGKSQREVMRTLEVGDRRVKRVRALAVHYGYIVEPGSPVQERVPLPPYPEGVFPEGPEPAVSRSSEADQVLLAKKDWILERLAADWHKVTIYEELGIPVGRSSFYRFLHRHRLYSVGRKRRVIPEIVHQPGEALILDWGKLRDVEIDGKKRTLWAFVGVLGFSRYRMVRLVWSNDLATTMTAIESMLREIGGVPKKLTSDNPKCFATEASKYDPLLNPTFERFAAHYRMTIECLPPAAPEKKGKVERLMPFVRRLYEAHGKDWKGIEESQAYLDKKLIIANDGKHGTTRMKPIEQLLTVEVHSLNALPPLSYDPEESSTARVRRDGHVQFDHKYYSVDETHIEKQVLVLANRTRIAIYLDGKLIETHERIPHGDIRSKSTKPSHLKPWEREMKEGSVYRKRAAAIGPDVESLIMKILAQGQGFIDTRKIWGILSLDKSYSKEAINEACRGALELGSMRYRTVKQLLSLMPRTKGKPQVPRTGSSMPIEVSGPHSAASAIPAETRAEQSHKFVRPFAVYEEQLRLLDSVKKPEQLH